MSSPPEWNSRPKRRRDSSPAAGPSAMSSPPPSSLPPSSPPAPFSDFGDEEDVGDDEQEAMRVRGRRDLADDSDDEGEDLFNEDNLARDYELNPELDRYSDVGLDDRSSVAEMSRGDRLAAEREMARRDRGLPGTRASRRSRVPTFLQSDDDDDGGFEGGLLSGVNTRRTRRAYDERMEEDEEVENELSLEHLGDVKTATVAEWIDVPQVRNAIAKHFRSFLMTFTDDQGHSVYGQRIKTLGEGRQ